MSFNCLCWEGTSPLYNQPKTSVWFWIRTWLSTIILRPKYGNVWHTACKLVVSNIVLTGSSLLTAVYATEKNIQKLQAVQNFVCPIVSRARKYNHVTPHLKSLSWLPVKDQLYYAKLSWLLNAFPDTLPNIWRPNSLPASMLPSVQLRVAKSSTYLFLKQLQDRTIGLWNNLNCWLHMELEPFNR